MSDGFMLYLDDDGVARHYDDTYDITIHCESKEEQERAIAHIKSRQWIPCSERLPEAEYPAIVTWKNDDPASYYQYILGKHYAGVAHYKNGKWYWYSSVTQDVLMEYGRYESEEFDEAIKVLAWMPLPEPYKGES